MKRPVLSPSIRWRLALLYTFVLGLCLLASDVLVYVALDRYLAREIDDSLSAQAQEIAATTRFALVTGPSTFGYLVPLSNLTVFSSPGLSVQILSGDGQIVRRSENLGDRELPIDRDALERTQDNQDVQQTIVVDGAPIRIFYHPLRFGGEVVGVLQLGRSLRDVEVALGQLRLAFFAIGALSLLVATLGGWWLARAALRPIDRLTRDAHAIGESRDFGRRVAELPVFGKRPRDEVGRLATTFNEMLGQLQEAYGELEQTLASQRRFVADASHELRTPLATVRTNLELLQRAAGSLDDADRDEALADALAEVRRLSRLVADLLTLARADSGLRAERREEVRVDDVVRDVYRQGRLLALPREQRLMLDGLDEIVVRGDPDQLKELLLILVDNAVTYTSEGGEIRLGAERHDGDARIAVTDNGGGIAASDLPHIFERFYRADQTRARDSEPLRGGTGLGLSIAHWIAEEHGGRIEVQSEPGRGSTFTVHLPALAAPKPRRSPEVALRA